MKSVICYLFIVLAMVTSCRTKEPPVEPAKPANPGPAMKLQFRNVVNGQQLVLKTGVYINAFGDEFSIKKYRYFVSNIKLVKGDGSEYAEPDSYHLIDQAVDTSQGFIIKGIPAGNYTAVKFLLGVDSLRNVTGAQTGALDPASGMFWDWNTGYIMAMLEGTSPAQPDGLIYHAGGFYGQYNALRTITIPFNTITTVSETKVPVIHITSDVAEWFKTPTIVDVRKLYATSGGKEAMTIVDNYADMFKIDHIE